MQENQNPAEVQETEAQKLAEKYKTSEVAVDTVLRRLKAKGINLQEGQEATKLMGEKDYDELAKEYGESVDTIKRKVAVADILYHSVPELAEKVKQNEITAVEAVDTLKNVLASDRIIAGSGDYTLIKNALDQMILKSMPTSKEGTTFTTEEKTEINDRRKQ